MSIKIIGGVSSMDRDDDQQKITAMLDSASDLTTLGTGYVAGSIAIVANASDGVKPYILSPAKTWVEV